MHSTPQGTVDPSHELERKAPATPVTVLIADDAQLVRRAIRRLLGTLVEVQIIGEAADYTQTVQLANDLRPQVIVMDLHLARREGVAPSDVRKHLNHGSRLLAVSIVNDEEAKTLAEDFGAVAFLDKMKLYDQLVPAILQIR
jgi:DNA-binding NarL/FixJ family response regulator